MFGWLFKGAKPALRGASAPGASPGAAGTGEAGAAVAAQKAGLGLQHHRAGRLAEAEALYREALALAPQHIDALHFLGVIAYQREDPERAAQLISQALSLNAANAPAHNNLGNALKAQGRLDEAIACFLNALAIQPDYVDAHINLGMVFEAQGKNDKAELCRARALARTMDIPVTPRRRETSQEDRGGPDDDVAKCRRALELKPDSPDVHFSLANALLDQGKLSDAITCYRKALALKPDFADAHFNLGNALKDQDRMEDAVACYKAAVALEPDFPAAYVNLGNALGFEGRSDEALACYRKALVLAPDLPEVHYNLAKILQSQGKLDEAVAHYETALAIEQKFPEAHCALGNVFRDQARFNRSLESYGKALSVDPEYAEARWARAMSQIPVVYASEEEPARCREAFSRGLDELDRWFDASRSAHGHKSVGVQQPFYLAYQEQDNRALLERYGNLCVRLMGEWFKGQDIAAVAAEGRRSANEPIRVGIVSQHFRNHSVWKAILRGWFEQLDPERFALHAFYLGSAEDQETRFAKSRARHFEQGARGLRQWVEAIREARPNVLIYPEIGMNPMTLKLASLRLAPMQVASWGHPETTGLATIDYYLSAEDLEPADAQRNYTEGLVSLPHLGCFYRPWQDAPVELDPGVLGIRADVPLLVCPGMPFKYAPQFDWVLAQIARRLGRCQLVFFIPEVRGLSDRLRQRLDIVFDRHGLRLDEFASFIPWQSGPVFDALMRHADVCLDTIGFSGFNTAMQALECDLPIVAREGRFLRGRLASGILGRMGLQELVAASEEEYVAQAVRLCRDAEYREHMRSRIRTGRHILYEDLAPIRAMEDFLAGVGT